MPVRHGHFHMESGYHSATWLDLEKLCLRPERVRPLADALGERLRPYQAEIICGPLNEGDRSINKKGQPFGCPFVCQRANRLCHGDVRGLQPFRATGDLELNLSSFGEGTEAVSLNCGEVYKHILAAVGGDEAEAFRVVE